MSWRNVSRSPSRSDKAGLQPKLKSLHHMSMADYRPELSAWDKITGTTTLTAQQAAVIKQTYILFGMSVFSALAGGYFGATSETLARFFSGWIGWIVAMLG